ncbi:hypothetical protein Vi05172_g5373 [Venturia inaequalis]|nr:hypothetical protein Vi05172_g5373 [Venturia inaequalis]
MEWFYLRRYAQEIINNVMGNLNLWGPPNAVEEEGTIYEQAEASLRRKEAKAREAREKWERWWLSRI